MFADVGLFLCGLALCPLVGVPPPKCCERRWLLRGAVRVPEWRILEIRGDRAFRWCSFLFVCIGLMYDIVHVCTNCEWVC